MKFLTHKKLAVIFLLLATVTAFLPSIQNGFTNWDDEELLTGNPAVRELSWSNTQRTFSTFTVSTYIPLTILTYSIEYRLWGLNPKVYHAVNLALHAANALMVLYLLLALGLPVGPALAGALFWAIHPLRVESVAWVTGRKDVLYGFFFLGSVISYLSFLKNGRRRHYFLSLLLFLLSGLSKGLALMLPAVLLLTDLMVSFRIDKKAWVSKIPFFLGAAGLAAAGLAAQNGAGLGLPPAAHHWWHRLGVASYNLLFYLEKTFFPARLSAFYPYPGQGDFPWPWVFWAAPALALAMIVSVKRLVRNFSLSSWGWLFFLLTVLPVLQLVKMQGGAMAADRYLYVPAIGLAVMAAEGWRRLEKGVSDKSLQGAALVFLCGAALTGLGIEASYQRCRVWNNSLTLWNDVLAKYPHAALAYNNRGRFFSTQGRPDLALSDFNHALSLQPEYSTALGNRALVYLQSGDYGRAVRDLDRAIAIDPLDTRNINNRGALAVKQGDFQTAMDCLNAAIALNPGYGEAYYNRGLLYYVLDDKTLSLKDLNQALLLETGYTKAYLKRARLYLDLCQVESAIADAEKAISLDPGSAAAYNILGLSYGLMGEQAKAMEKFDLALKANPEFAETYYNLATLLYVRGEYEKAWHMMKRSLELNYKSDPKFVAEIQQKIKQ